jgi:hypothetical protein
LSHPHPPRTTGAVVVASSRFHPGPRLAIEWIRQTWTPHSKTNKLCSAYPHPPLTTGAVSVVSARSCYHPMTACQRQGLLWVIALQALPGKGKVTHLDDRRSEGGSNDSEHSGNCELHVCRYVGCLRLTYIKCNVSFCREREIGLQERRGDKERASDLKDLLG